MRTHLEFRSDDFAAYPGEEEEINPNRYGKRLAEYVAKALPPYGFTVAKVATEDWGWRVDIRHDAFSLWIGCGNYQQYQDGFLCFIEPSKPFVRRWLKLIPTSETIGYLATALDSIIRANGRIRDVRWWTDDEVAYGQRKEVKTCLCNSAKNVRR